jgi:hypothetical protein
MSTAHTCFRSALTQAFRPSNRGIAASYSVASFLIPALGHPARRRPFSTGKRRSKETVLSSDGPIARVNDTVTYNLPPKPTNEAPRSKIPLPPADVRSDIQQWLAVIDPFLPAHLRQYPSNKTQTPPPVTSIDLALVINAAQDASFDLLSYVGLVEGRWTAMIWMTKKLAEDGRRSIESPPQLEPSANIIWPELESRSLKDLTEQPLRTERVRPSRKLRLSLDDLTSAPDSINVRHVAVKRALGQLWRTLGNIILAGAEQSSGEDKVMPHVLEIIAHLHHVGLMPDSVYTYHPRENEYALQQPPTLHMLSSKILTALSDASWKAHEASVRLAKTGAKTSYSLGHEIPGSRYRVRVTEVVPALWLELVLWSCLHGGWTSDGIAILEQIASRRKEHDWSLISWREIMLAEQQDSPAPSRRWGLYSVNDDHVPSAEERAPISKTFSSEIVTAFVDAAVNEVRVGVGARGIDPDILVGQLKTLKDFLDSNNLSLGSTAWDSVMARLLETGAFIPEKRPEVLLRLFELATSFGVEVNTANTCATLNDEVPYFFEPTTLPLNLLHRTMQTFTNNGDIQGAMDTLMLLQKYTDGNKQKSLQQFFEMLKSEAPQKDETFTSRLPPIDFPAFEINMPVPLRARLLDLATESKLYDLCRWLLFAQDIDGPLIGRELYVDWSIAASIVRFGTLAGENDLVLDIVKSVNRRNGEHVKHRMPAEVLEALLCSQLKLHRWDSIRGMQQYVAETGTFKPRPIILSTFAAELLRLSTAPKEELRKGQDAFTRFLFAWEDLVMNNTRNELYCILAIMSTVDDMWEVYCSQFLAISFRQDVQLSTQDFNQVLWGILDSYGAIKARSIVDTWCHVAPDTLQASRSPGGLLRMPRFYQGKGEQYDAQPQNIELMQESGAKLTLSGRVQPNRQTFWAVLRKVQEQVDQHRRQGEDLSATERAEVRDTLRWAARHLLDLGYDYEAILHDMGSSLAELAEVEAPAPTNYGDLSGADPGSGDSVSGIAAQPSRLVDAVA